jgi:hypothetical protein
MESQERLVNPVSPPPLPSTSVCDTFSMNTSQSRTTENCAILQAGCLSEGNENISLCTDNPLVVDGLSSGQLYNVGVAGLGIGLGFAVCGCIVDECANRSDNPNVRRAGMLAADACLYTAAAPMFTPAGPLLGATACGHATPAAAATITTAWAASLPTNMCVAYLFDQYVCTPSAETVRPAPTTRSAQYQALNEAAQARTAFEPTSQRMGYGTN